MRLSIGALATAVAFGTQDALAADPKLFFFVKWSPSTTEIRNQLIERMDNISRWSCTNEPGVAKYALFVPRNASDTLTMYSIESYADDETFRKHLDAELVSTSLFDWSKNTPNVWASPVSTQNFTVIEGQNFVKPDFVKTKEPYVVVESQTYMAGGVDHVIEHWEEGVEASRDESGTLAFGLFLDPTNADKIWTLGVYESEQYLNDVHSKSHTALEVEEHTAGMREGVEKVVLQKKGGFLYRGSPECS